MTDTLQWIESLNKISNKFDHTSVGIFCAELKTRVQILLKLSKAFYCQDKKLLCQSLNQCSAQEIYILFRENLPMKFEILIFPPARRKFTQSFCAKLETRVQILLKLPTVLSCKDRKLICPISPQAISLLDETN